MKLYPNARLNPAQVAAIRAALKASKGKHGAKSKLARKYGVSPQVISRIARRQAYLAY